MARTITARFHHVLFVVALLGVAGQAFAQEYYHAVELNGVLCGYVRIAASPLREGARNLSLLRHEVAARGRLLGAPVDNRLTLAYHVDPITNAFSYHDSAIEQGSMRLSSVVRIDGRSARVSDGPGSREQVIELPDGVVLANTLFHPHLVGDFVARKADTKTYLLFDGRDNAVRETVYTRTGTEVLRLAGRDFDTVVLDSVEQSTGVNAKVWLDTATGVVVQARIASAHPARTETLVDAVAERLRHADPDVRVNAAWVLGELASTRAAAPLVTALGDGDAAWMAAMALGALAAPEAAVPLARALRSDDVRTRRAAAWALDRLQKAGAVAVLQPVLGDTDAEVRYWASQGLHRIGTPEAASALAAARPTPGDRDARRCAPPRSSAAIAFGSVRFEDRHYRLYPEMLDARPDIPSPLTAADGTELVLALLQNGRYGIVPATLREADGQCRADGLDFPTLERAGLHSEAELERTRVITGRSAGEIADLAQPGALSDDGFMAAEEDVVDVLKADNRTVAALGLTHPELARPLFHIWNMMRTDLDLERWDMSTHSWGNVTAIVSHGRVVRLVARDSKGGQFSIFADGLDGAFGIEIGTDLTEAERAFLHARYSRLDADAMDALVRSLTRVRTGEIQPHYIMWYGFYEGTTPWRTDPVALAFVFGLRTLEQIEAAVPGQVYTLMMTRFARPGPQAPTSGPRLQ